MTEADGTYTQHIEVRVQTDAEPVIEEDTPAEPSPVQPAFNQAIPKERSRQPGRSAMQRTLPLRFAAHQPDRARRTTVAPTAEPLSQEVLSYSDNGVVSEPQIVQGADGLRGIFADLDSMVVEVGDLVFIRYNDQPDRRLSIRLSDSENNPSDGFVHVSQPLGTAILGTSVDEEITMRIGNRTRTAVIEKIEKPRPVEALAAE
jgi:hypothetical protein